MLLPTKGISHERALLTLGAEVLDMLQSPTSISGLWTRFSSSRAALAESEKITFDWFSLTLTSLYCMRAIDFTPDGHLRRTNVRQ